MAAQFVVMLDRADLAAALGAHFGVKVVGMQLRSAINANGMDVAIGVQGLMITCQDDSRDIREAFQDLIQRSSDVEGADKA